MSENGRQTPEREKKRLFRPFRILRRLIVGLTLFLALALVAGGLWLRTDQAARTLANVGIRFLEKQGLFLQIGSITGPLPTGLRIENIEMADANGLFFRAASARLVVSLSPLLLDRLEIEAVEINAPELLRLPDLPPGEETPPPDGPLIPILPLEIVLERLALTEAAVADVLLAPPPAPQPGRSANASSSAPPVADLRLDLTLSARLKDGRVDARASGEARARASGQPLSLGYELAADTDGKEIRLEYLRLRCLDILAELAAETEDPEKSVQARLRLSADDGGAWQTFLSRLSAADDKTEPPPPLPFGGRLTLELALNLPQPLEALAGELSAAAADMDIRLSGSRMRWPSPQLDAALGPDAELKARLSGGLANGPDLHIENFTAGVISASGTASIVPARQPDPVAALLDGSLESELRLRIADLAPFTAPAGESAAAAKTTNEATPDAESEAERPAEAAQEAPLSGGLEAVLHAAGPLYAPRLDISAKGDNLALPTGPLGEVAAELTAKADAGTSGTDENDVPRTFSGTLKAAVGRSPGGPLALSGNWRLALPATEADPLAAALQSVRLTGAGLALNADISASLPPGRELPLVSGELAASVTDWKAIADLSGAPLSGRDATCSLRLTAADGRQAASVKLDVPTLRLRNPGERPTLILRRLTADVRATDIFGNLAVDGSLQSGFGRAAFLRWNKAEASVKGAGGRGDFSLALQQARGRGPGVRAQRQNRRQHQLLNLRGAYDLTRREVSLAEFALKVPYRQNGLSLQKPLRVHFDKGLAFSGLDLAFLPSGRLAADAAFEPGSMRLTARLSALPFAFFKLMTDATLPDGQITAQADFSTINGRPQGAFSAVTRISAVHTADGVIPDDAAAIPGGDGTNGGASGGVTRVPASGMDASLFELQLNGSLSPDPGPAAAPGSGARAMPGVVWLRGQGHMGSAGKAAETREGRIAFQLPLRPNASSLPLPDAAAPFAASILWNGPVEVLWQTVPMPDRYLSGQALADIALTGSQNAPKTAVRAYLANAVFEDVSNGVLVKGIDLQAENTENGDVRLLLSAKDDESGSLAMEVDLVGLRDKKPAVKARGQLENFSPVHRDDLSISLSGLLGMQGPVSAPAVHADIRVNEGELILSSRLGSASVTTLETVDKRRAEAQAARAALTDSEDEEVEKKSPTLDLHIAIPRSFFIRGMGLDSEWQGDLRISGQTGEPALTGSLAPVRGYLDMFSRTFIFSGGDITFSGGTPINPLLNLELTFEGPDITALIRAGGTVKKPKLTLESRPPLPEDEVLAHVLFGKRTSDLSRFEAVQLANSLRELSGGGSSLDLLTGTRKQLGLDMLRLSGSQGEDKRSTSGVAGEGELTGSGSAEDASDAGLPALEAGKYINDSIYVGIEQGASQDSTAVRVEVELFPSVTLEGKSTSEASEVGLGWKMDY